MKVSLRAGRQRDLFALALAKYDALAKGTAKNLESLALPTLHVDLARGNVEAWKTKLATSSDEMEIPDDLRVAAKDALDFVIESKYAKIEKDQTEFLIGTSETEETINELRAIRRKFMDQGDLELVSAAASEGGETA